VSYSRYRSVYDGKIGIAFFDLVFERYRISVVGFEFGRMRLDLPLYQNYHRRQPSFSPNHNKTPKPTLQPPSPVLRKTSTPDHHLFFIHDLVDADGLAGHENSWIDSKRVVEFRSLWEVGGWRRCGEREGEKEYDAGENR